MQKLRKVLVYIKEDILLVLLVALFFTFIMSHNEIPSDSMVTNINVGDHIFVNMLPYYYRSPERGEIVVFDGPDGFKWIKRVVGMPGETVDIIDGNVYIDGEKLDESAYLNGEGYSSPDPRFVSVVFPYTVPEDSYFLMGDNRLSSDDSRYYGAFKEERITGKALIRIYPFNNIGKLKQ